MDGYESELKLVMPFVVCKSQGGPYEDDSFVAGYHLGVLDHRLESLKGSYGSIEQYVLEEYLPQIDLLAMRHGFTMHTIKLVGEWIHVRISNIPGDIPESEE